jgi:hypothetical protein
MLSESITASKPQRYTEILCNTRGVSSLVCINRKKLNTICHNRWYNMVSLIIPSILVTHCTNPWGKGREAGNEKYLIIIYLSNKILKIRIHSSCALKKGLCCSRFICNQGFNKQMGKNRGFSLLTPTWRNAFLHSNCKTLIVRVENDWLWLVQN